MTSDGKMRAVAVDGVAGEVEIALAIPCFILCAMRPQMWNLASIEDVLLSFGHDTAPFFVELTACRHTPTGECLSSGKTGSGKDGELTHYELRTTVGGKRI